MDYVSQYRGQQIDDAVGASSGLNAAVNEINARLQTDEGEIAKKVDKVNGKDLSDNNYSTEEKQKLSQLPTSGQIMLKSNVLVNENTLVISNQ